MRRRLCERSDAQRNFKSFATRILDAYSRRVIQDEDAYYASIVIGNSLYILLLCTSNSSAD
jgi:hypothetical protein